MSSDLLEAAKNGYYNQVLSLLSAGVDDVDARDKDRATPLYWSASRGHLQICQALVDAGCDVNAKVKWGSTALHAAADRGHADCLALLIQNGAEVNVQNERGDTALHLAAYRGFRGIVQHLVDCWADPFAKNSQSKTPLQEAQSQQHSGAAAVLQAYMEFLGYRPFVSLPTTAQSEIMEPAQESPVSVAAKSWPHFRSCPRYPPTDSPTQGEPAPRANTFPIMMNNLSPKNRPTRSHSSIVHYSGGEGGEAAVGGLVGSAAGPDFHGGMHRDGGEQAAVSQANPHYHHRHHHFQHTVSEPTESMDEYSDYTEQGVLRKDLGGRVNGESHQHRPGLNDAAPPCPQSPGHFRTNGIAPNGRVGVAANEEPFPRPGWPPRAVGPPHRPISTDSTSFLNKEDLAMFAESLQLEVVNLRDSLASREKEVKELQGMVSSLERQNASLQQVVLGKQHALDEMLSVKDRELSDLRRRVGALEKQNANLQQAITTKQKASEEIFTMKESDLYELHRKVSTLERLNASLEQVIVNKQDMLKSTMASKDHELSELRQKLITLEKQVGSSSSQRQPQAVPLASGFDPRYFGKPGKPGNLLDDLTPRSAAGQPADDPDRAHLIPPAHHNSMSRSLAHAGDAPASQTSVPHESPKMCHLPHGPSALPSKCFPAGAGADSTLGGAGDATQELDKSLRSRVAAMYQDDVGQGKLDADGREWSVERDYSLQDDKPVNCQADGQRKGSCSLVFRIKHKGRRYVLKMLMNLINLHYDAHSLGRSLDAHLLQNFGAEFHAPLLLHAHPNIVRVRHHYQGDTTHFRSYLPLLVPSTLDVPIDMARRTTFLVMDEYPQTLQSFVGRVRGGNPDAMALRGGHSDVTAALPEQFLLHLLYQLLSAVEYLQRHHVVHRDIKADNVFLDWRLRPVLGDFGFARTLCGYQGEAIPFTDRDQVFAGNPHAWAPELSRFNKSGPPTLPQPMSLEQVYSKSDEFAVGRMFYSLLRPAWEDEHSSHFPVSSQVQPHYPDSAIPTLPHPLTPALGHMLSQFVLDDPARRPSVKQAVRSAGVLLCRPKPGEVTSLGTAEVYCRAHLLKLVDTSKPRPSPLDEGTLSIAESLAANQNQLEANFLLSLSYKEFWETLRDFQRLSLL
nr:hypothetical protein BaRGS_009478 [Batillaria attramentaria]